MARAQCIVGISAAPLQDQPEQPYHDFLGIKFQTHDLQQDVGSSLSATINFQLDPEWDSNVDPLTIKEMLRVLSDDSGRHISILIPN
jgi:hypothetical protein